MSAVISDCGLFRLRLDRECGMPFEGSRVYAYFGINPSTAGVEVNDSTVCKWIGFTKLFGGHRFIVGNVFSFRATDVKKLTVTDVLHGPGHAEHIDRIIAEADVLVPCWGNSSKVPRDLRYHIDDLLVKLLCSGKPVMHFGRNDCGDPKHPLFLPYTTQLTPWETL